MFRVQQNILQDSTANQTVHKDLRVDSLRNNAVINTDTVKKFKHNPAHETKPVAVTDSAAVMDTSRAETPVVSLFTGHELKPLNPHAEDRIILYPAWISVFLLFCVVILAYLRTSYYKRFIEFFRAVADKRFALQTMREEKALLQRTSVLLLLVFFLSISSFIYILLDYYKVHVFSGTALHIFLKILLSVFLLFLFRVFITETTGFIFDAVNEFSFYRFNIFLFNKALGIALLPVVVCLIYASAFPETVFIWSGILFVLISWFGRLARGLNIGLNKQGFNKFYLFFYFCTLEILPVAVLAKIILLKAT